MRTSISTDVEARINRLRGFAAFGALLGAAAHMPSAYEHLWENPRLGLLLTLLTVGLLVAARLVLMANRLAWALGAAVCSVAIAAFVLSRLMPLAGATHHVGQWGELAGLVSVAAELVTVALAARVLTAGGHRRPAEFRRPVIL